MHDPGAHGGANVPRRRGLFAQLQGLSWWQLIMTIAPLGLAGVRGPGFIGATLAGGIGGAAFGTNAALARKDLPAPARFAAMFSVGAAAAALALLLQSALSTSPEAALQPPPALLVPTSAAYRGAGADTVHDVAGDPAARADHVERTHAHPFDRRGTALGHPR